MLDSRPPLSLLSTTFVVGAPKGRPTMTGSRRAAIIRLLETLNDARDPSGAAGSETAAGKDDRLLLMNQLWHGCCPPHCVATGKCRSPYAELERVLRQMRAEAQSLHWHVSERYLRSRRQPRQVYRVGDRWRISPNEQIVGEDPKQRRRGTHKGQVQETRIVETWDPAVRAQKVERGVTWIDRHFQGKPRLAKELGEAA